MNLFNRNDHNVYILGAGFSAAAGIPVVRGFLNASRDAQDWLRDNGRAKDADAIEEILGFRLDAASAAERMFLDLENIEELFSLASASQGDSLTESVVRTVSATIDHALWAADRARESWETRHQRRLRVFAEPVHNVPSHWASAGHVKVDARMSQQYDIPLYDALVGLMCGYFRPGERSSNTIVSLNYDTLVEEALGRLGMTYTYGFAERAVDYKVDVSQGRTGEINVLKLHGSLNWAYPGQRGQGLTIFGSSAEVLKKDLVPYLVPPTWKKSFGDALSGVWDNAVAALSQATRIVIVGYSMPPTDTHFKYLLAAGLQRNASLRSLSVVDSNPDAEAVAGRFFQTIRPELADRGLAKIFTNSASDIWDQEKLRAAIRREVLPPFVRQSQ